jgi:glycosyltransferase involved in cell wall biosynthesis
MNDTASPLISVVIPTYNHAHFLGAALQSVLDQTYSNWEAIVIDNHSTDNTDEVVNGFADSRITLLKIHNKGVIAASRNVGIKAARGEWIAFLDSDDLWYPRKLERCLQKIASGCDFVCHGEVWVSEQNGVRQIREVQYGPETRATFQKLLFEGNCISTSAVIVSQKLLKVAGGFDESKELITAEDYHLWLKLVRAGAHIGFVNEMLGEYIIHAANTSKAALRNMQAVRAVFEKVYAELEAHPVKVRVLAWRRRAIIDYSGARGLQVNKEYLKAWPLFMKAILRWPFNVKFYVALLFNILGLQVK